MNKEEIIILSDRAYKITLLFPKKDPLRYRAREVIVNFLADYLSWQKRKPSPSLRDVAFDIVKEELEILDSLFELAKKQNWVSQEKIADLQKEYKNLEEKIEKEKETEDRREPSIKTTSFAEVSKTQKSVCQFKPDFFQQVQEKEPQSTLQIEKKEKPTVSLPPIGLRESSQSVKLDERQKKVLKILQEKKKIKIGQLIKEFPKISRRTILRDLEKLTNLGFALKKGEGRGTYYQFNLPKH